MGFSTILNEAEIYTIPKIWEKWIYIVQAWENRGSPYFLHYLADLELMRTHVIPMFGNVQILIKWKYSV